MTVEHGVLLGIIGTTLTIVGFYIAFWIATKPKKKVEISNALKDLFEKVTNGKD